MFGFGREYFSNDDFSMKIMLWVKFCGNFVLKIQVQLNFHRGKLDFKAFSIFYFISSFNVKWIMLGTLLTWNINNLSLGCLKILIHNTSQRWIFDHSSASLYYYQHSSLLFISSHALWIFVWKCFDACGDHRALWI